MALLKRAARIVFVNRYFYPDVSATSQMLFDLARRLVEHGIEVHVVCSRQLYDDPAARLPAAESVYGIRIHRVWTARFGRARLLGRAIDYASFYLTSAMCLLRIVGRDDLLVAKTDPPLISIVAAAVAGLRGAQLVNWLQDVFPEVASKLGANPLPPWLDAGLKALRDRSLAAASMNVVLGSRMREYLERRAVPSDRIRVIENWADGAAITPMTTRASNLRRTLDIHDKFVIAYSGNLGRAHEFETLLAAAEQLRGDAGIVFLMIGGGAKMDQLRNAVREKQLASFIFLPYQPREALSDALAAGDVHLACLLPELEGLIVPSKFYGILAAGRPVIFIGDTQGELGRIVLDAQCGATVECGEGRQLAAEISALRLDQLWRQRMGERARALFLDRYTVERATRQWLGLISGIGLAHAGKPVVPASDSQAESAQ